MPHYFYFALYINDMSHVPIFRTTRNRFGLLCFVVKTSSFRQVSTVSKKRVRKVHINFLGEQGAHQFSWGARWTSIFLGNKVDINFLGEQGGHQFSWGARCRSIFLGSRRVALANSKVGFGVKGPRTPSRSIFFFSFL